MTENLRSGIRVYIVSAIVFTLLWLALDAIESPMPDLPSTGPADTGRL
jgi:hypothetical protein